MEDTCRPPFAVRDHPPWEAGVDQERETRERGVPAALGRTHLSGSKVTTPEGGTAQDVLRARSAAVTPRPGGSLARLPGVGASWLWRWWGCQLGCAAAWARGPVDGRSNFQAPQA